MGPSLRVEDFWNRATRLGDTTGRKDWATRLGEKTGRHDWATRLSEKTGRHLRGPGGGSNGRRKNDRNSQSHFFRFLSPSLYTISMHARSPPHFFLDFRAPSILQVELSGTSKSPGWPRWSCRESHFLASPTTQWTKYWEKMTRFWQMDLSGMPKFRTRFFTESRKFPWSFFSPCVYRGSAGEFECHVDKALA